MEEINLEKVKMVMGIILVIGIFLFVAIALLSLLTPTAAFGTALSSTETLLLNTGTTSNLSNTPTQNLVVTATNQTWLAFNNSGRVAITENNNFSQPFTISFWFKKPTTSDGAAGFLVCDADSAGNQRSWQFHTNTGNDILFLTFPNGTNTNITTLNWNNFVSADTWYHVVGTSNGTFNWLYGNGVLIANGTVVPDPQNGAKVFDGTSNITLGNCQSNSGFYNGSVDEVAVFNRSLSYAEITNLFENGHTNTIMPNGNFGYFDNFVSYAVGNDTMKPNWLPQYSGTVNITSNKDMMIDYIVQQSGDRDDHAQLNVSKFGAGIQNVTAKFKFNVTACNVTFFATEGISPIGSSSYLWYADGNNFLSAEIKTNSTNITASPTSQGCGGGDSARFTIYKRVAGVTTALNPQTFYTFAMNTTYNVTLQFLVMNATTYNFTASIDGVSTVSSTNITTTEVQPGAFLLEVAGTRTLYDNVNLTYNFYFPTPKNLYRLNENSGTKVYDWADSQNGTITSSSASYSNDGISLTLDNTDYSAAGNLIRLLDSSFAYSQLSATYQYGNTNTFAPIAGNVSQGYTTFAGSIPLIFNVLAVAILVGVLLMVMVVVNKGNGNVEQL